MLTSQLGKPETGRNGCSPPPNLIPPNGRINVRGRGLDAALTELRAHLQDKRTAMRRHEYRTSPAEDRRYKHLRHLARQRRKGREALSI